MGFPGKIAGAGCHFLLQSFSPTQGSNPCLLHLLHWKFFFFFFFFTTEPPGKPLLHIVENKFVVTRAYFGIKELVFRYDQHAGGIFWLQLKIRKKQPWNNFTGEEILTEIRWFWLWNMPVSDLYKCSHCGQVWLMTVGQSGADSLHYKDIFFSLFLIWTLLKNVTQSYLAPGHHVLSSLHRGLRLIGNQLWQSGKRSSGFCAVFFLLPKRKQQEK